MIHRKYQPEELSKKNNNGLNYKVKERLEKKTYVKRKRYHICADGRKYEINWKMNILHIL